MSVIEHPERIAARFTRALSGRHVVLGATVLHDGEQPDAKAVEYVPAEHLRGAVRVRDHFREALRVIAANEHGDPADRNLARAALAHPGGGQ
jgi:hypothetical protein